MEDIQTPEPQIVPPNPLVPDTAPAPTSVPPPVKKQSKFLAVFIGIAAFSFILAAVSLLFRQAGGAPISVDTTPTPTNPPTVTQFRRLTPFATESAFLKFETTIESLPGVIQGAAVQDTTILPPILELKLGF